MCSAISSLLSSIFVQEEEDDNYLDTVEEDSNSVHDAYSETSFPYDFQEELETESADP